MAVHYRFQRALGLFVLLLGISFEDKLRRIRKVVSALIPQRAKEIDRLEASNKAALQVLLGKWRDHAPERRWLSATSGFTESPALPGVGIQVLGPHPDNPWIKIGEYDPDHEGNPDHPNSTPGPGEPGDSYLAELEYLVELQLQAQAGRTPSGKKGSPATTAAPSPFKNEWKTKETDAFKHFESLDGKTPFEEQDYLDSYLNAHDASTNNLSLCLLFSYGNRKLLFTGDAQYGAWKAIYKNTDLLDQLSEIDLLKVSHHASHNGTPASLIRNMNDFVSQVSTNEGTPFESIPRHRLLEALEGHGPVLRSDDPRVRRSKTGWYSVQPGPRLSGGGRRWTDTIMQS